MNKAIECAVAGEGNAPRECQHVGCVRSANRSVRGRDYCESHAGLREGVDAEMGNP